MLRIIQNSSAAGAMSYYSTADYYNEGQELVGQWHGQGAERLGLSGTVDQASWDALCDNRNPTDGSPLTARRNQERSVGYDFNFHVPKSVSILYGLTRGERILDAFRQSVDETMRDMEAEMQTRVRVGKRNEERATGNMVWGEFTHFTSRPVDGVPDPHLHAHCFVFNATYDDQEARWKAGQFRELKRDAPYFEAKFHSRMARRMAELGLAVERTKAGWEIAGVPKSAIRAFSRRTAQIEQTAKEAGITSPEEKDSLGARTREHKQKDMTLDELRDEWRARLSEGDASAMAGIAEKIGSPAVERDTAAPGKAVELALGHCFERQSVVPEREVQRQALRRSFGEAGIEDVEAAIAKRGLLTATLKGRRMATTPEVLSEEQKMIDFARKGRGTCRQLLQGEHAFKDDRLNRQQVAAVLHVLQSRDRVIVIRGAAGVGKTTMMKEAVSGIEAGGKKVFTFAPSADASRGVLREEGFANADTVARLLVDTKLQDQVAGQVLWIDEAGLLGTKTTGELFALAGRIDARVILTGDRRQHGSVERGAALRLLETEAGIVPAEIKEIQRQRGDYKQAVKMLSDGRVKDGFRQLDRLGWVKEADGDSRDKMIANDYVATVASGQTALVVSPTHTEGERITTAIRDELRATGRLKDKEHEVLSLTSLRLTESDRADATSYVPGDVLVFHQNAKGAKKGDRAVVGDAPLPLDQAARFQAFRADTLKLASGDLVRVTQNGMTADGKHRLNNGGIYKVRNFTRSGDVVLDNGWRIGRDFGHLAYGYVATSHASQGKTVDKVIIGQSADSFAASSREQFYVSVSRGRKAATIYTDDKASLLEAFSRSDERISATDLMLDRERLYRGVVMQNARENEPAHTPSRETRERQDMTYER